MSGRATRGVNVLLAAATLVLGCIAMYCARGLEQERARAQHMPPVTAEPLAALTGADEARSMAAPTAVGAAATAANKAADPGDQAVARYRLSRLGDSQGRAEETALLADQWREWEELAAWAGLSAQEAEALVALVVETRLEELRSYYACEADPACRRTAYPMEQAIDGDRLVSILGPEKAARIQAHQAASAEHQFIRFFRELPAAAALDDADVGRLALAMAEERRRFEQAAAQAGMRVEAEDSPYIGYALRIATAPSESRDLPRKLESATQYTARVYERAAAILPPAPLARFRSIQDAALDSYRRKVQEMEVARAVRRDLGLD